MSEYTLACFQWLLKVSGQAIVLAVLVLLAQWLTQRHMAAKWRYSLWFLVIVRLMLPFSFQSPFSIYNIGAYNSMVNRESTKKERPQPITPFSEDYSFSTGDDFGNPETDNNRNLLAVQSLPPEAESAQKNSVLSATNPLTILQLLWLIGLVFLVIRVVIQNYRFSKKLKQCLCVDRQEILNILYACQSQMNVSGNIGLIETDLVQSPALYGLVRRVILLPPGIISSFSVQELRYVFMHELAHVKRKDMVINWITVTLKILHWFNPFIWLVFRRMESDRELACDALVLSHTTEKENQEYGCTIIKLLERFVRPRSLSGLVGILEDKQQVKRRIAMIARFNRKGHGFILAALVFLSLGFITLTEATTDTALVPTVRAATEIDMVPPHRAASGGDIADVEQWLAQGGDVNVKNPAGETLLRRALLGGRQDIIQLLQKHGADIDAEIQNNPSFVRQVATNGNHAVADDLISRGADTSHISVAAYLGKLDQVKEYIESDAHDVSVADKNRILMGGITGGHVDIIEYILDHGAVIKRYGLLDIAVRANRKHILELLIAKGANPNPGGGWSPLHITIWYYPRLEMAKVLLSHGADPYKEKGENAWNPMHYAIDIEKKDMVRLFLDHSRDTDLIPYVYYAMAGNHKDVLPLFEPYVDISPIHLACFYGKLDEVKSDLEKGNDIEAQDTEGLSLLQCAVSGCQMEIVDYLIAQGCNVNSKASGGATALHHAANKGMVQRLITAGALVEAKDNDDCTPFFYAFDSEAAGVLLKHGADINSQRKSDGATALHEAASRTRYRNMKRMKWLIAKGADVNRRKKDGSTPLSVAVERNRLDAVQYLLEHGADINCKDDRDRTPLFYAARNGIKETVEMLLKKDPDMTVQDDVSRTAIGIAKYYGHAEIVELLSKRAKQIYPKKEIMTFEDYAAIGDTGKIRLLIAAGRDVNTKSRHGTTALSLASDGGHTEIAELLIQNGANVNIQSQGGNGYTPLLIACSRGHKEIVELLLANGANISVKNNAGDTALDIASERKHTEIVELLQKHGAK